MKLVHFLKQVKQFYSLSIRSADPLKLVPVCRFSLSNKCEAQMSLKIDKNQAENLENLNQLLFNIISREVTRDNETKTLKFCEQFELLTNESKNLFLVQLCEKHLTNQDNINLAINSFKQSSDLFSTLKATERLRALTTPFYVALFHRISRIDNGIKFLVNLRARALHLIEINQVKNNQLLLLRLKLLTDHLKTLLNLCFSIGFLQLNRITWNSSCNMLQKISEYEAVHPVKSWTDIKKRVGPYRRCYVFTHSSLPEEPLVILHIALTQDISSKISDIVNVDSDESENDSQENLDLIKTAIFYSIASPQKGLNGIELGTQMIKEMGKELKKEFPMLEKMSSLSPIPGFKDYLLSQIQALIRNENNTIVNFLTKNEEIKIRKYLIKDETNNKKLWLTLQEKLRQNALFDDHILENFLQEPLMRKCAHYLFNEKRRGYALNSVAHFHLRNGSIIWRLNWRADISLKGLSDSFGMMINYRYYLEEADKHSQEYIENKIIQTSDQFKNILFSIKANL